MARAESFDGLLNSIQEAFLSVNKLSEQQHLESIKEYFDENDNPRCLTVNYPFFNDAGEVEYRRTEIPTFCLVPLSSLKIKEVNVDFKVKLAGKVKLKRDDGNRNALDCAAISPKKERRGDRETVGYIPSMRQRENDSYANISLKFLADEPPEGLMRIRDEMIKIIP